MTRKAEGIPCINRIGEVSPSDMFQIVDYVEDLLRGWHKGMRKQVYLFRGNSGQWVYYDRSQGKAVEVTQWKEKSAWVYGDWVQMSKYHKLHVRFTKPIKFTVWEKGAEKLIASRDAVITLTDTAHKTLAEHLLTKDSKAVYSLRFKEQNRAGGKTMRYVERVDHVGMISA